MRKIEISSELVYALALVMMSLASVFTVTSGIGLPLALPYMLHMACPVLSLGQSEYAIQGILFIAMILTLKKIKLVYVCSYITGILCGLMIDVWRLIPFFNAAVTPPEALTWPIRIMSYIVGFVCMCSGVVLVYRSYFAPNVYDSFVKNVSEHFGIDRNKFKITYDISVFTLSVLLSLLLFKKLVGIGIGTVFSAFFCGIGIMLLGNLFDRYFAVTPKCRRLAALLK